jgi:hypothetical protein
VAVDRGLVGRDELWPDVAISPPEERSYDAAPIRASDVEPEPGPLWITYWVWAVGTPFVKIGRTQYQADRDGRWEGKAELARRRVREWSTGCMYPVQLIRCTSPMPNTRASSTTYAKPRG